MSTPQTPPARKRITLLALCLAAFIISLDVTIVNVALPALVRQTGATTTDLQWVVDAYNLVFAALVLVAGSMSDRLGRKGMLLAGLGVFSAASLAGSFCTTAHQLIGVRAVMGLGAAMMFPATLPLLTNVFTALRERAAAIGLWGATTGVGIATGPIIGGWLLEHYWWGSVFLFMVPVAAGVAALAAWAVPTSRDPRTPKTDWPGLVLSAAGMGVLVLGIIQAPNWGWGSPRSIGTLAAGVALLAAFAAAEARTAHPMLDIALFRNPRFTAASGSVAIAFFALNGFIFLTTQYFQIVKGFGPLGTGVRLLPVAGSVAVASVAGTRLAVPIGNKMIVGGGADIVQRGAAVDLHRVPGDDLRSARRSDDRVRDRDGADPGAGYRGHHGRGPEAEGRRRVGRQRRDQAIRQHPRRRRHRQRRRLPVHQPTRRDPPGRAARPGQHRRPGISRRRCRRRPEDQPGRGHPARIPAEGHRAAGLPARLVRRLPRRRRRSRRRRPGGHLSAPGPAPRPFCPRPFGRHS